MTREEEIKTLQSLKGDTYFAQLFSSDDIDKMCSNIKNDFGIELGLNLFDNSTEVRNLRLKNLLQANQLEDLGEKLDSVINAFLLSDEIEEPEKQLYPIIGVRAVVLRKLKLGKMLTREEADYIIKVLEK